MNRAFSLCLHTLRNKGTHDLLIQSTPWLHSSNPVKGLSIVPPWTETLVPRLSGVHLHTSISFSVGMIPLKEMCLPSSFLLIHQIKHFLSSPFLKYSVPDVVTIANIFITVTAFQYQALTCRILPKNSNSHFGRTGAGLPGSAFIGDVNCSQLKTSQLAGSSCTALISQRYWEEQTLCILAELSMVRIAGTESEPQREACSPGQALWTG